MHYPSYLPNVYAANRYYIFVLIDFNKLGLIETYAHDLSELVNYYINLTKTCYNWAHTQIGSFLHSILLIHIYSTDTDIMSYLIQLHPHYSFVLHLPAVNIPS